MKRFTRQHFLLTALLCVLTTAPVLGQAAPQAPPSAKPGQAQVNWNYALYGLSGVPGYSFLWSAWSGFVLLPGCNFQCGYASSYPSGNSWSKPYSTPLFRIP